MTDQPALSPIQIIEKLVDLHGYAHFARRKDRLAYDELVRSAQSSLKEYASGFEPAHPAQPILIDNHGVKRFKSNQIVRFLLDQPHGATLNQIALMCFSDDDRRQFAQLIGYSVSGYQDLGYSEPEESE